MLLCGLPGAPTEQEEACLRCWSDSCSLHTTTPTWMRVSLHVVRRPRRRSPSHAVGLWRLPPSAASAAAVRPVRGLGQGGLLRGLVVDGDAVGAGGRSRRRRCGGGRGGGTAAVGGGGGRGSAAAAAAGRSGVPGVHVRLRGTGVGVPGVASGRGRSPAR